MLDVILPQPSPVTGDYENNARAFLELVEAVENKDRSVHELVVVPLGALEGVLGLEALMNPDVSERLRDEVIRLGNALLTRPNRSLVFCVGPQVLFTTNTKTDAEAAVENGVLRLEGMTFGWGRAIPEGAMRLDFNRFASAQVRRKAAPGEPTLSAGIAGGLDEQVYSGDTGFVFGAYQKLLRPFHAGAMRVRLERDEKIGWRDVECVVSQPGAPEKTVDERYEALRVAVRDYVGKNRIKGVVVGVSGGVDSALVLALACDAIGADRVRAVLLPSRFTSEVSDEGAARLLEAFGVKSERLSIEPMFEAALSTLEPVFGGRAWDVAEENVQARIRGLLLMGVANKNGELLLCTSNKAESAMGYGTLYGDLTGGFAPLIDLWKSDVYALCRARNAAAGRDVIPSVILERAPSAELREDQKDSDSLPPYDTIEKVMTAFLSNRSVKDVEGVSEAEARSIVERALRFGFKRHQGILGPVVSATPLSAMKAYGVTRRGPF